MNIIFEHHRWFLSLLLRFAINRKRVICFCTRNIPTRMYTAEFLSANSKWTLFDALRHEGWLINDIILVDVLNISEARRRVVDLTDGFI